MMRRFLQSDFFYDFRNTPVAVVSFIVFMVIILAAVFAGFIAPTNPFDPASLNLMNGFTPPMQPNEFTGEVFLMGSDDQGRDLFSTILYGLRISLFVAVIYSFSRSTKVDPRTVRANGTHSDRPMDTINTAIDISYRISAGSAPFATP